MFKYQETNNNISGTGNIKNERIHNNNSHVACLLNPFKGLYFCMLRSRATKSMEIISVLKDNVLHCFQLFILVLVFFRRGNQCDQRKSPTKFITKSCHDRVHFTWAVLEFSALADCVVCCKSNYTILYTMMPLLMLYE